MEIGTAGIMRAYMARPCDVYFTLERKLERFLRTNLCVFEVPKEEIEAVIASVLSLDIRTIADDVMQQLFRALAQKNGLILPVVTLALYPMAYITRLTRSSMLDVLGQDYIRTARAKGLKNAKVIFKHALKNAMGPVVTYAGPMMASILTGSMVVENIFSVPGLGRLFVNSMLRTDYMMIMGVTIFLAILIVTMNFLADVVYKLLDPRIDLS